MTKPYLGEIDSLDEDDSDGGEHKDHGNDDDKNDDCDYNGDDDKDLQISQLQCRGGLCDDVTCLFLMMMVMLYIIKHRFVMMIMMMKRMMVVMMNDNEKCPLASLNARLAFCSPSAAITCHHHTHHWVTVPSSPSPTQ